VANSGEGVRIINSNERMEAKFGAPKAAAQPEPQESSAPEEKGEAGFTEGIEPQNVDVEAIRREAIEEAKKEAERITAEAEAQAQKCLKEAQDQAQLMLAEHKQLGYQNGLKEAEEELQQKSDALEQDMRVQRQELADNYEKKLNGMESDIVDAIINVFDKVFNIQFEDKRDILLALVNNTLMDVDTGDKIRIHANEKDYPLFQEHMTELQEKTGPDVEIEFVRDNKLAEGQCQIETPYGVFDCGVDTELASLMKDIRSLA
jgi:flagellar assembly protein FliH